MRGMSIRVRLTLWYGGVLAVVLAAFGAAVYFTMRHQLLERIDQGLREEMADVLSEVHRAEGRDGMLAWLERRFGQHEGFDFQITDSDGERVFANARLEREMEIPAGLTMDEDDFGSQAVEDAPRRRVISRRARGPDGVLVVQIARSLEHYDHEMGELLFVLLVVGPLTLVVALGGGYLLARRALAPVDRMTEAANRIGVQQLDQRLEVANAGDELGRLGDTLNAMLDRLERSFREMQRFTADASHELRTPISVIRTEAEVALNQPASDEGQQELLGNILEECNRLTWITDQLLTLSREDAGVASLKREAVDFGKLVNEVAETMRPLAQGKQVTLVASTNGQARVAGDADRLRHVVYNLLDNAIKYTPDKGRVELVLESDGDRLELAVRDTGIGIAADHLPHVFERFYRVDKARTRAEGGSGLGLSIVQTIVAAHGGDVRIDSTPGEGTTCIVHLPIAQ